MVAVRWIADGGSKIHLSIINRHPSAVWEAKIRINDFGEFNLSLNEFEIDSPTVVERVQCTEMYEDTLTLAVQRSSHMFVTATDRLLSRRTGTTRPKRFFR